MSDPFLGEIRTFPWSFAPKGWAFCNGQILAINQNQALFALLSTMYGGNGTSTFGLPDLRGRTALHFGTGGGQTYQLAQTGGSETVQLTTFTLPAHNHVLNATTSNGDQANATNGIPAKAFSASGTTVFIYTSSTSGQVTLATDTIGATGGNGVHDNVQPFLVLNPCIALQGIFPSRS